MSKRIGISLLIIIMIVTLFAGCAGDSQPAGSAGSAVTSADTPAGGSGDKIVIGYLYKQCADTFVKNIKDAVDAYVANNPDVELLEQDAEGDINKQLSQAEAMITQGIDVLVLNAVDAEGSGPIVDMANEAGIPVVECNTLTNNENYSTYVGSDDVNAGKIQADFLKTILPEKAKVCIMLGPIGVSPQIYRKEGIDTYLLKDSDIEVLQEQTANWKREEALTLAENWLTTYQDLDAIICQNDDMAMGALEAVEAAGRKDSIIIVGIDAITDALEAVKNGQLDCTVFQDSKGQAEGSIDAAIALARGESVDKAIMIPFQLVTKDNVADFQ